MALAAFAAFGAFLRGGMLLLGDDGVWRSLRGVHDQDWLLRKAIAQSVYAAASAPERQNW